MGLFASSCSQDGQDDENLIFIDLLKQLTSPQAKIIKYSVENSRKVLYPNGLVMAEEGLQIHVDELKALTGVDNIHRLDRELDSLRYMGLLHTISGGFSASTVELIASIEPTYLALSLYVRCEGYSLAPDKYWSKELITNEELRKEKKQKAKEEAVKRKKAN